MLKTRLMSLAVATLFLTACSDHTPPPPQQYSQPTQYQQQYGQPQYPQQAPVVIDNSGIGAGTAILGAAAAGAAGYMIGKSINEQPTQAYNQTRQAAPVQAAPVVVTPSKPATMTATPAQPAKPFEPVRVHEQPKAAAPVVAAKPATFAPVAVNKPAPAPAAVSFKPATTYSYKPSSSSSTKRK